MAIRSARDITAVIDAGTPIDEALAQAARAALRRHKQAGLPVAVWRDGHVAWVPADTLDPALVDERPAGVDTPSPAAAPTAAGRATTETTPTGE